MKCLSDSYPTGWVHNGPISKKEISHKCLRSRKAPKHRRMKELSENRRNQALFDSTKECHNLTKSSTSKLICVISIPLHSRHHRQQNCSNRQTQIDRLQKRKSIPLEAFLKLHAQRYRHPAPRSSTLEGRASPTSPAGAGPGDGTAPTHSQHGQQGQAAGARGQFRLRYPSPSVHLAALFC